MKTQYLLQVEQYENADPNFVVVGFINFLFDSQEDASYFYYDQYPGHRSLNKYGDWTSGWSSHDDLRFRVVPYSGQDVRTIIGGDAEASARVRTLNLQVYLKYCRPHKYVTPKIDWTGCEEYMP